MHRGRESGPSLEQYIVNERERSSLEGKGWPLLDPCASEGSGGALADDVVSCDGAVAACTRTPRVSVVIATLNRPRTLARLLECVYQQTLTDIEVIVVDDGSSPEVRDAYASIWPAGDNRFRLKLNPPGGGPGRTRNTGIRMARGEFVAFCDDDDIWLRADHLERATAALHNFQADLYIGNMQTADSGIVIDPDWYGKAGNVLEGYPLDRDGTLFDVPQSVLANFLQHRILHANTLVARRDLLTRIGLYWDKIHFAEDHDFALRLSDASCRTLYSSVVQAELDVTEHPSIARRFDPVEQNLFNIIALLHSEYKVRNKQLRRVARRSRADQLLQLSVHLQSDGRRREAIAFAIQSILTSASWTALRHLLKCYSPYSPSVLS